MRGDFFVYRGFPGYMHIGITKCLLFWQVVIWFYNHFAYIRENGYNSTGKWANMQRD
jgi:hypothetical protein